MIARSATVNFAVVQKDEPPMSAEERRRKTEFAFRFFRQLGRKDK